MAKTKIPTLHEAMMKHYKRYKNGQNSADQYIRLLKQCIKILGNKRITQFTCKDVTKLIDYGKNVEKNSNDTINIRTGYFKSTLKTMSEEGFNVDVTFPRNLSKTKRVIPHLNDEEINQLWNKCRDLGFVEHLDIFQVLLELGCRSGELLGVRKKDINFSYNQILFEKRKCNNPIAVPMTDRCMNIISLYAEWKEENDLIFPYDWYWLDKAWTKVRTDLNRASDSTYTIHILRHTAIKRMIMKAIPIPIVSKWVGHENIQQTMAYAHFAPYDLHKYVEVMNK
tara:strand:+ start:2663 stop:3508 length:846 start_codon:yes stop_codon:yes gene_type:complete